MCVVLNLINVYHNRIINIIQNAADVQRLAQEKITKARGRFFSNISHELRTPLNAVLGFADLIECDSCSSTNNAEYIGAIKESADDMLNLVNNLLDTTKLSEGKMVMSHDRVRPRELAERLYRRSSIMKGNGVNIYLNIDVSVPYIIISDESFIHKILGNYLSNAIKFTSTGNITITINVSGDNLLWSVRDTGKGVSAENVDLIFQRFQQEDASTTREFGGSGLGLSLCSDLVELLGGTLGVESILGIGSSFWFSIPLIRDTNEFNQIVDELLRTDSDDIPLVLSRCDSGQCFKSSTSLASLVMSEKKFRQISGGSDNTSPLQMASVSSSSTNPVALIADDNKMNCKVLQKLLSRLNVESVVVHDGKSAIDLVTSDIDLDRYCVIFMDCHMPIMDGFEATRKIRELEKISNRGDSRIIICGLTADVSSKDQCIAAGMDYYETKPVRLTELKQFLTRVDIIPSTITRSATLVELNTSKSEPIEAVVSDGSMSNEPRV
jgi:CheY-like chemotaxis protein/two-component sensor histidine kinase